MKSAMTIIWSWI